MIKTLAVALSVTFFSGSPAMAAYVVPGLGQITNAAYVSEGVFRDPTRRLGGSVDVDEFLGATPRALSTSTAGSLFATAGGFVGADQQLDATWSSEDAGTISIDFEALLIAPGNNLEANNNISSLGGPGTLWKYGFRTTEDSLLTFNISTLNDYIGAARDEPMYANNGILRIKQLIGGDMTTVGAGGLYNAANNEIKDQTFIKRLDAGMFYSIEYEPFFYSYGNDEPGTTLLQASQRISWSIGARAVEPPDPGSAVPEPATWAMMILGFGLAGGAMRRRRSTQRMSRCVVRRRHMTGLFAPALATALALASNANAAIELYVTRASFLAAISVAGIDTFSDLPTGSAGNSLARTAGAYAYDVRSDGGLFVTETAADPSLAPYNQQDGLEFSFTSPAIIGVGGYFNLTDRDGQFTEGVPTAGIFVTAFGPSSEAIGAPLEYLSYRFRPVNPTFIGFVSTTRISHFYLASTDIYSGHYLGAVDDLTLGVARGPGPAGGVPEPGAWAMMLSGFFSLGALLRRHRRRGLIAWGDGRLPVSL